jgi:Protein of unknown function (DUF3043)
VPTLFRRKSTASVIEPDNSVEETIASQTRGQTQSKREQGLATPKRNNTGRRVGGAPNAQLSRREVSAQNRELRVKQREAMMRGDERALLPRDRGPERALVRDMVDSRRNASSYFFIGLLFVLILSTVSIPVLRFAGNVLFVFMVLTVLIDGVLLSRLIKRTVTERLPKATPAWRSLYFYGIMRATSFRRMRVPRPRLKVGDSY